MQTLLKQHCVHYSKDTVPLTKHTIQELLDKVDGWSLDASNTSILKTFKFKDYYKTIAFINAIAYIFHQQDHHPELKVTYNTCQIELTTHSMRGLSLNDFICAAHVNTIVANEK